MFRSFFIVAFRNITRQKAYAIINILGLAIGLACSILIVLFITHELSYDKFHEKGDRIYRLYLDGKIGEQELKSAWTAVPTAPAFLEEFPELEDACRMEKWSEQIVRYEEKTFQEDNVLFADSTFFNIFSFNLLRGDPDNVLKEPNTVVISDEMANKYFGNEDPVDKVLKFYADTTHYRVTGVMEKMPENSHIYGDFVVSYYSIPWKINRTEWTSNNLFTYFLMKEGASVEALQEKIDPVSRKYIGPEIDVFLGISLDEWLEQGNRYGLYLQPLKDIHLNTDIVGGMKPVNDIKYIYLFSLIAVFILLIAAINFMNLATARSAQRSREVGMRKVVGSGRNLLIRQFLTESLIMAFISLVVAIVLVELLITPYNNLVRLNLSIDYFGVWYTIPALIGLALVVGLTSGSYPAFMLSSFKPVSVLTGKLEAGVKSGWLRRILVVVQFGISVFIIIGTIVIYQQLSYMLKKDLGFYKEQLLVIQQFSDIGVDHIFTFKEEISKIPGVISSASSTMVPGHTNNNNGYLIEGRSTDNVVLMNTNWVDYDYIGTYGIDISEGRFFKPGMASDSGAVVVNQSAIRSFNLKEPLTKRFIQPTEEGATQFRQIIGVVNDFHYMSLHNDIEPYVFILRARDWTWVPFLTIRFDPQNVQSTLREVEKVWDEFSHGQPFQYFFLDDDFATRYAEEERTRTIFTIFAILAIFIAALGLFGMAAFTTEQRTKEIGVRKVMGASIPKIVMLISRETVILVGIATVIACPVAFYFARNWLIDFHFRIDLGVLPFVLAFLFALALALVTVSFQTVSAALKNPAESLRYE
jgi:putative ABC transport system permease protein